MDVPKLDREELVPGEPVPEQPGRSGRSPVPAVPLLLDGEPAAGPWREVDLADLLVLLAPTDAQGVDAQKAGAQGDAAAPTGRPWVVAVDGRGGSGKSTLAARLAQAAPRAVVVSTDDVAWHHSFFGWADLLLAGVLRPARSGTAVAHRPPPWDERGRPGSVEVPAGTRWLVLEGVGAARRELVDHLDAVVWVQSDAREAERRGIARDVAEGVNGDLHEATRFWHEWQAEEQPFLRDQEPWSRADVVVGGVGLTVPGDDGVLVAPPPGRRGTATAPDGRRGPSRHDG